MSRALVLAEKGRGKVHPNPMVGAVLVRGTSKIAEGYHRAFGEAHAEVDALRKAGQKARGSTLYVNLEPCSHWGKTPPCVDALIEAGVKRVVAAMRDPNPQVSGQGFAALKKQGVAVTRGVLEQEAVALNRAFVTWVTRHRPYVTMKVASSIDGRTATITGESKWITSEASRAQGYRLRAQVDAVAVGAYTVLKDNPSLTAHGWGRNPVRIVFAGRRKIPRTYNIFRGSTPAWVIQGHRGSAGVRKALRHLARQGIAHLLVEGGLTLQRSFLDAGVVDEVIWFMAPMIMGHARRLKDVKRLSHMRVTRVGEDLCLQGLFRPSGK